MGNDRLKCPDETAGDGIPSPLPPQHICAVFGGLAATIDIYPDYWIDLQYAKSKSQSDKAMKKFLLVFVALLLAIGANLSDGFLARIGIDANILLVALGVFVIAGLIANQNLAFIVIVCTVAVAANLPDETARSIGYDPDLMLGLLVGLVLIPFLSRHL